MGGTVIRQINSQHAQGTARVTLLCVFVHLRVGGAAGSEMGGGGVDCTLTYMHAEQRVVLLGLCVCVGDATGSEMGDPAHSLY